jgi:hypothetical protein
LALCRALAVTGAAGRIGQLLHNGGYTTIFDAPRTGHLTIDWYLVPPGAHIAKAPTPTLVAAASVTRRHTGRAQARIKLTSKGRRILAGAKHLALTAKGSFTPTHAGTTSVIRAIDLNR